MNYDEAYEQALRALDKAGVPVGDEHRRYTLVERIEILGTAKDYFARQTEKARSSMRKARKILSPVDERLGHETKG